MAIDQESIIGELIPDVKISRITLQSGGSTNTDSNPHIDVASERNLFLPDQDNLKITLDLFIKETLSDDVLGSWLDNIDIQKYLKIKIFQSTHTRITSILSLSQDMIELLDEDRNIDTNDKRFKIFQSVLEISSVQEVLEQLKNSISSQTISTINKKNIKEEIDSNGNKTFNVNYNVNFNIKNSNPSHLAYFVFSSFDILELAKDFNLEFDSISLDKTNGKIVSEIVIDEGKNVESSHVFLNENGEIWTGAVHLNGLKWRSRSNENENSIDLTREIVTNHKLQDFRNVKEIKKLQFSFTSINEKLGIIDFKKNTFNVKNKSEYFSDIHLARDRNGDAKFFFTINFEKLVVDFTIYGGLIKRSNSRFIREMIKQTKIRQLRVLRRRVRFNNGIDKFGTAQIIKRFDVNESDELIAISGEKDYGTFKKINNNKAALREILLALDTNSDHGLRHFTGMDKTISELTDGDYQYGVEVDIDDSSIEFFVNKLQDLRDAKIELEEYLNEGSKISISKNIAEVQDPHIEHASEHFGTSSKTFGNFDIDANRFTKHFINLMARKYAGDKIKAAPWISPILVYADILDIFTDAFKSNNEKKTILNCLLNFVSPQTGNPSGISAVIKLIENLISMIQSVVNVTESDSHQVSSVKRSTSHSNGKVSKKSFKVEKFFLNNSFDSNISKGIGSDYLSNGRDDTKNDDGLKKINSLDFIKRIDSETLRYFNTLEPDINISYGSNTITSKDRISNTSFSYLSPSRIDFPNASVSLIESSQTETDRPDKEQLIINKKNRASYNINDGPVSKEDKIIEIQSNIIFNNVTERTVPADIGLDLTSVEDSSIPPAARTEPDLPSNTNNSLPNQNDPPSNIINTQPAPPRRRGGGRTVKNIRTLVDRIGVQTVRTTVEVVKDEETGVVVVKEEDRERPTRIPIPNPIPPPAPIPTPSVQVLVPRTFWLGII